MIRYVLRRLLLLIPVIIIVSVIVFSLMELAPGTVIDSMITGDMSDADVAELMRQYNLDRPMVYRYGLYMLDFVRGDLGVSDYTGISVWNTYISRLPNTLILSFSSLIIGSIVAVPLGIFASRHAGKVGDNVTTTFSLIGMSMPNFWLGLLLIMVFSSWLGLLPVGGNRDGIRSIVLPAVCSSFTLIAMGTRQTRSAMLEVLKSDYLRTARAKGVPEKNVIRSHALGNAWIPIITTMGNAISISLAGSVVVESVFAWPGVGRFAAEAVMARDVTATTGIVIMTTLLFVLVQLIVDIFYALVDPRVKAKYISVTRRKRRASPPPVSITGNPQTPAAAASAVPLAGEAITAIADSPVEESNYIEESSYSKEAVATAPDVQAAADGQEKSFVTRTEVKSAEPVDADGYDAKRNKKRSQLVVIFSHLRKNKGAMAGFILVCLLFAVFILSLFISFDAVSEMNIRTRFASPSLQLPFGADSFGRNMLLRVIYGTRYTVAIGFGSVGLAAVFGVSLGCFAGYYGGKVEDVIMRFSDVLASIPGMLLGMVIMTVLGAGLQNLVVAVGISSIPNYIRITRASVLNVRNQEFIEAAHAIGISNTRIIFTQVLTNGLSPIIVTTTGSLGVSILTASSLSFLGFGVPVATPEWGAMIAAAREFSLVAPWVMLFPGLFIMITVLAFNLIGDGLRDALDPKLKR